MEWQLIKRKVKYTFFFVLQIAFFSLKFVVTVFVSSLIISSHVITESLIISATYVPFLQ